LTRSNGISHKNIWPPEANPLVGSAGVLDPVKLPLTQFGQHAKSGCCVAVANHEDIMYESRGFREAGASLGCEGTVYPNICFFRKWVTMPNLAAPGGTAWQWHYWVRCNWGTLCIYTPSVWSTLDRYSTFYV